MNTKKYACNQHNVAFRAGFKGGQTGQLPRATTTRGAYTKTVNRKHKNTF